MSLFAPSNNTYSSGGARDFLRAKENKAKALAGVEVESAEMAMRDGEESSRRAAAALGNATQKPTGGGTFSRLAGRRGGVSLGGLLTGGLAAANRAKLVETKKAAIGKGYRAEMETLARQKNSSMTSAEFNRLMDSGGIDDEGRRVRSPNRLQMRSPAGQAQAAQIGAQRAANRSALTG